MKVSIFKDFASTGKMVELDYVFDKIRNGGDFVQTIETIRQTKDENEQQRLKKTLPGVCFCGIFKERKSASLIRATGLVILDFDDKDVVPDKDNEFIYALWKSPRGGYKGLIQIPEVADDAEFKQYFFAIHEAFPEIDPSGKDISRFCFISYDPDIHINPNAKIWTKNVQTKESPKSSKAIRSDFKKLNLGVAMIDNCDVGNRNNTILKAGKLMGGYIASGELNEVDVLNICERAIFEKDNHDYKANFNTFRRGIEYGKAEPLTSDEVKEITADNKLGKIDYSIEESFNEIEDIYNKGFVRGLTTGWQHFDKYYSVQLGSTTYIYGSPFSGKTKWTFNLLINLSRIHGLKHLIYSPETGASADIYSQLIQIYAQGDLTNTFKNQIKKHQLEEAKKFIGAHFIVVSTDETDDEIQPQELLAYTDVLEKKYNTKIHTITIDPWNELKHDNKVGRSDLYLNEALKAVRINARKKQRHIFIVTHIQKQRELGVDELGTKIYPFPVPEDIAEGQNWYRKGFMMLSFYRHFIQDGHDNVKIGKDSFFGKNELRVRVQKYKPEGTGMRGEIEFRYEPNKHIFTGPFNELPNQIPMKPLYNLDDDDEVPF
jgi:hypothetical protein